MSGRGGQRARGQGRVAAGVYRPDRSEDGEEELLEEVQEMGTGTRLNRKRKMRRRKCRWRNTSNYVH
jgi:hypothetical protein